MKRSVYRQKKRHRATPAGKPTFKVKNKVAGHALCGLCHAKLGGVPRRPSGSKTQNRPQRPFGGVLCAGCTQRAVLTRARLAHNVIREDDVPLSLMKYVRLMR